MLEQVGEKGEKGRKWRWVLLRLCCHRYKVEAKQLVRISEIISRQ